MKVKLVVLGVIIVCLSPLGAQANDQIVENALFQAKWIDDYADDVKAKNDTLNVKLAPLPGLPGAAALTAQKTQINTAKDELKAAETKLKTAVTIAKWGDPETAVVYARRLLQQKKYVDALQNESDAHPGDKSRKDGVEVAKKDLEEMAKNQPTSLAALKEKAESQFQGFGFGVAIGALIDTGKRDRIESANLDPNGIVRVERDSNTRANFLLESHYFFTPDYNFPVGFDIPYIGPYLKWVEAGNWGHGPFVAVQPGSEDLIEGVGIGWMVGFKRAPLFGGNLPTGLGDSFNLGVGVLVDPSEKVLGDGITENSALPTGETVIRFKETSQLGALILFSYSFH
jgi:hypothetical protein